MLRATRRWIFVLVGPLSLCLQWATLFPTFSLSVFYIGEQVTWSVTAANVCHSLVRRLLGNFAVAFLAFPCEVLSGLMLL